MTSADDAVRVTSRVERKDPALPRFVVVPASALEAWELEGTIVVRSTGASKDRRRAPSIQFRPDGPT